MAQVTIAVVGGSGNTGQRLARRLGRAGGFDIRLMGRTKAKVDAAAARVAAETGARLVGVSVDAGDRRGLGNALAGADMVVSTTSATETAVNVAAVALDLGIDYFDTHLSSAQKWQGLRGLEAEIERRGLRFVSDGGFHPGLPAVMVRQLATQVDLSAAPVYACLNVDWSRLSFGDNAAEDFASELRDMAPTSYRDGAWQRAWSNSRSVDFGPPYGGKSCIAMGVEEIYALPSLIPGLRDVGFYIGGFGPAIDYGVLPLALAGMAVPPLRRLAARWLFWGLRRFCQHDEWALLLADGRGKMDGRPVEARLGLFHDDPYELTAIAAAAAIFEMRERRRPPGLYAQGLFVDPGRFLDRLRAMGVRIEQTIVPA